MSVRSSGANRQKGRGSKTVALPADQLKDARKARHLPMFGPDLEISIPLHLLPAYMKLYDLHPMTRKEIHDLHLQGRRKPDGLLWVRREPKEGKNGQTNG